jgi:hypothetical protein
MPERNLVAKLHNKRCFILLVAMLTIVTMQLGCSKFRQSTLGRDFLEKRQPNWHSDEIDSASHYDADPDMSLDSPAQGNDSARIAGVSDDAIDTESKTVKLVAHQPASEAPGDHDADCDCCKPRLKPKLPYTEPIEPPSEVAAMTPPIGLVSHPLAPIWLDSQTKPIQTGKNPSNHSLPDEKYGSIENDASLVRPDAAPPMPERIAATEIDVDPIRVNPADDRFRQPIRDYNWSDSSQAEIKSLSPRSTPNCPCDGPTCDGSCKTNSRRIGVATGLPALEPEPAPPFAECPPDDVFESQGSEFAPELEIIVPDTGLADVETRSFDDLNDEQWIEIFGPAPAISHDCPRCTSKHCDDPNCAQALAAAISGFESELEGNDFQPQEAEHQAAPIAVASTEEFDNDFSVVSHTVDVGEVEPDVEPSEWLAPETTDPPSQPPEHTAPYAAELPLPDFLTHENFAPVDSSQSADEPRPTDEPVETKNAELVESKVHLQIANGALCTEVTGFGQFKPFRTSSFESGQRLLVYCEVDNYTSTLTVVDFENQFVTRLRGSYAIHDAENRVVQEADYPIVEDVARNQRRDFYMHFPIQLGDLQPGAYRIKLQIEDLNGNQTAALSTGMKFNVR